MSTIVEALRDKDQVIQDQKKELDELRTNLENLQAQLSACGAVALCDSAEELYSICHLLPEQRSTQLEDVVTLFKVYTGIVM